MRSAFATPSAPQALPARDDPPDLSSQRGWRYGLMGFPLAFVALPLYVVFPNFYAKSFGLSLTTLGALLLVARLMDAAIDPLLGRWSDQLYSRSRRYVVSISALAGTLLVLGFALLFFPPMREPEPLLLWAGACLMLTYVAYSALAIFHQSWGAMLGGDDVTRSRIVAWREGFGLAGVLVAAVLPGTLGLGATAVALALSLGLAWWAWSASMLALPPTGSEPRAEASSLATKVRRVHFLHPFSRPGFRSLFAVFVVNGIASAIPATLLLFFVQDRLQAPPAMEPMFLASYFLSAALAMPLWLRCVKHWGLVRTWLAGMVLSVVVFVFATQLGAGDAPWFLLVCIFSGVALGTDLTIPGALLAGTITAAKDQAYAEGSYFGWWNFASKLNLALAAGLALPALAWLGYTPGTQDPEALHTLTLAYCLLPCALKLVAAALLYLLLLRKKP